jgi:membrane protease YdiL (CAAX protease family)
LNPPTFPPQVTSESLPPTAARRIAWPFAVAILALAIAIWLALIQRFGAGDVYAVIGPYACALSVLLCLGWSREIRNWLQPQVRPVLIGLAVGVLMTAATYPVFQLAAKLVPELDQTVKGLYSGARSTTLPKALAWVVTIIAAEELMFRGVWPHVLSQRMSQRAAYALSLATYVLAQFGTGSYIVALMALVCGAIWSVQRVWTNSLLSSFIAHLIWTPTVILLYPVN